MSAVGVTILFLHPDQISWAAVILCPTTTLDCNGTTADDIIFGNSGTNIIHGLAGNDHLFGSGYSTDYIYGDDGNDVIIGSMGNDALFGGNGNDKYDGDRGDDTILERGQKISYSLSIPEMGRLLLIVKSCGIKTAKSSK